VKAIHKEQIISNLLPLVQSQKIKSAPKFLKKIFLQDLNLLLIPFGKPKGTSKCHDATMHYAKVSILKIEMKRVN